MRSLNSYGPLAQDRNADAQCSTVQWLSLPRFRPASRRFPHKFSHRRHVFAWNTIDIQQGLSTDFPKNRRQFVGLAPSIPAIYAINVGTGDATIISTISAVGTPIGLTYDPIIDRFWAAGSGGFLFTYDPNIGYAGKDVATGIGAHSCIVYVPLPQ